MRYKECRLKNQQGKNESTIKISTTVYEIIYLWNLSYSTRNSVRKGVLFVPIFMWLTYHVDVICLPTLWIHMLIRLQKVPNWSVRKRVRLHATMALFAIYSSWMNVKFLSIFAWGVCRVAQPLSIFFRSSNNKRRNAFANFLLVNNHHHTTYARTSNMNAEKKCFANTAQNTFNHFLFAFNIHASQSLQDF